MIHTRWVRRGSSRGPSRHRGHQGCRKTGLEGTCGLGGGRGTLGENRKSRGTLTLARWAKGLRYLKPTPDFRLLTHSFPQFPEGPMGFSVRGSRY